ncbi:unnamed protein product [Fraxinus pennsylvanica]|uniref:Acetyltransferase n=1 Tax=Fraxinus pennsylvanica TaxID=56036 RepID=A0AAD2DIR1_9LAMI|nr:unnamed protein product [Fraxinus pennsylvanica]
MVRIFDFLNSYFGNAIQGGAATATPNDLLSNGLGWAAQQLNQMIAAKTLEEAKNNYENWLKCPRLSMKGARTNTFVVGSSPQFNVYVNDFGWGKPVVVRDGLANKFDGKFTAFPGVEEGSVDIDSTHPGRIASYGKRCRIHAAASTVKLDPSLQLFLDASVHPPQGTCREIVVIKCSGMLRQETQQYRRCLNFWPLIIV